MSATVVRGNYVRNKIHPKKFALLVACASIMMMFAALTSAYMVRKAGGNWLEFPMPSIFLVSTVVIVLSSITLHIAYISFKRGNEALYKGFLLGTFGLGIAFLILQYQGWLALSGIGIELTFLYICAFWYSCGAYFGWNYCFNHCTFACFFLKIPSDTDSNPAVGDDDDVLAFRRYTVGVFVYLFLDSVNKQNQQWRQ